MSEEINLERDMEPDPMFRIKCLKKQLQWMESQRYDLETTVSSLRAILKLIVYDDSRKRDYGKQIDFELIEQAKRMIKL
jgi:hypothetical protein